MGTALCAGWALAPDLDHPEALLARSLGPVSWVAAKAVGVVSDIIHDYTRSRWDRPPDRDNCHRTFTHTLVYAVLCYVVGTSAGRAGGPWAAALFVFTGSAMGIYAALPPAWRNVRLKSGYGRRRVPVPVAPTVAAGMGLWAYGMTSDAAWWIGLAMGVGCFVHCLGDSLTLSGCPWLWPVPLGPAGRKRRWYPIGVPRPVRFRVGGGVEARVVTPALVVFTVAVAAVVVAGPARMAGQFVDWLANSMVVMFL